MEKDRTIGHRDAFSHIFLILRTKISGKLTSFGKNVQYLLYGCKSLKEFTVPASIETIPERCFYNSQYLETIRFEKGSKVESIGKEAFYACYALKDVELAEGLTTIGESAFLNLDQILMAPTWIT